MDKKIISTEKAPQAIGPYSQAIVANGFLFTSGMVPIDPATNQLVEGDITVQAKQAISNLKNLIEASGSSCDKVVKTTVFIKDMNQFSIINDIYKEYSMNCEKSSLVSKCLHLHNDLSCQTLRYGFCVLITIKYLDCADSML